MITRMQSKTLRGTMTTGSEPRLSLLEKAMLRWVVVDPDDKLLDANIGSGKMAEYLRRNMQCEICGVSDNMEHVRYARSLLRSSDIVYAAAGDIPWREDAFDTVLMKLGCEDEELLARMFAEAQRVLKPGGQLILGLRSQLPSVLMGEDASGERRSVQKETVLRLLEKQRYHDLFWQRTGITNGVVIAWKPKPEVDQVRKAI